MRDNMQNNNLYSYTKAKVESLTKITSYKKGWTSSKV